MKIASSRYGWLIATALTTPAIAQSEPDPAANGEIIVTATKRDTSLQTTAAAVSVVGAQEIASRHLGNAADYLAGLPGVSYQDRGAASNSITIRGIGIGSQIDPNSPVGTYFGETPLNGLGTEANANAAGNADLKLVDIQQVEVLRGPQGTLYGSGTMGGTVRVNPNPVRLDRFEGYASAEYSNTARFGGSNYKLQGVVNAPLVEGHLGVRLVGWRFFDDGYIKNVAGSRPTPNILAALALNQGIKAVDQNHVGSSGSNGVRAMALWRPVGDLSINLMYVHQDDRNDGYLNIDSALGDYLQARTKVGDDRDGDEFISTRLDVGNAIVRYDLPWGSLLNSTSVVRSRGHSESELTFYSPIFLAESSPRMNLKQLFINEARFSSKFSGPFQVLAGTYYENRRTTATNVSRYLGTGTPPPGLFMTSTLAKRGQKQLAFFGEATLKLFDDRLSLTGGGRYFKFDLSIPQSLTNGIADNNQGRKASITGTNWKGNVSYEFSKQLFVYAQFSQGFRAPVFQNVVRYDLYDPDHNGLLNFADNIERKVPEGLLEPDRVKNYEVGIRFKGLDNHLQGSFTLFRIDWSGIPLVPSPTVNGGAAYYINAGQARSQGAEFEAALRLPEKLRLSGSVSYIDSKLSETQPGLGTKGTRLPGSARWNATAGLEKRFELGGHDAFVRGDWTYIGDYTTTLTAGGPLAGDYHQFGASGGVTLGKVDIGIFVKNLTNSSAATWWDNLFPGRVYRLRPRTIGTSASIAF